MGVIFGLFFELVTYVILLLLLLIAFQQHGQLCFDVSTISVVGIGRRRRRTCCISFLLDGAPPSHDISRSHSASESSLESEKAEGG